MRSIALQLHFWFAEQSRKRFYYGREELRMTDDYNMAIRKLLKQVGVTSQSAIEAALRDSGTAGQTHKITVTVKSESLALDHEVSGEISPGA